MSVARRYFSIPFFLLDLGVMLIIAGIVILFVWRTTPIAAWGTIAVGILLVFCVVPVRLSLFRWQHYHDSGMVAYERGDLQVAELHWRKAEAAARRMNATNTCLAQSLNNLAGICATTNREAEAKKLWTESLEIYQRASGPGPNRTEEVRRRLDRLPTLSALMNTKMNGVADLPDAIKSCQQLRGLFQKVVSAQDDLTTRFAPDTQREWNISVEGFIRHLSEHHGWKPESQAECDSIKRSIDDVAQQLGL